MCEVRTFSDGGAERGFGLKRPKDIRLNTEESKVRVYEELEALRVSGAKLSMEEHRSGFPSVLIRLNEEPAYLTDVLSVEKWWANRRKEGQ